MGYSPSERRLFSLLRKRPRDTKALSDLYYGPEDMPYHGRKIVVGLLSSLARKGNANDEPWLLLATRRAGPRPMSFWLEEKDSPGTARRPLASQKEAAG